jgi:hypothetical protein
MCFCGYPIITAGSPGGYERIDSRHKRLKLQVNHADELELGIVLNCQNRFDNIESSYVAHLKHD